MESIFVFVLILGRSLVGDIDNEFILRGGVILYGLRARQHLVDLQAVLILLQDLVDHLLLLVVDGLGYEVSVGLGGLSWVVHRRRLCGLLALKLVRGDVQS